MNLYQRLSQITPNGLIVRDGVIDWYFDRILPLFERAGHALFIIGFDISRQKTIELIKARGDTATVKEERFYVLLDEHAVHIERFRQHYMPDYLPTDATLFDHESLLAAVGKRLAHLKTER